MAANPTPAQEEFAAFVSKNSERITSHPDDHSSSPRSSLDRTEEDDYRAAQIDAAMRIPTFGHPDLKLPPASFDAGRTTGVKGVIADARNYENARKTSFMSRVRTTARKSIMGVDSLVSRNGTSATTSSKSGSETEDSDGGQDEESFLAQWRESRRREMEAESRTAIRNRRTSPSVRVYGRLDEVDALGYLDAIEKVRRETVVVVFVYDPECPVSATIESAMLPLVSEYTTVHFVKVHYVDIEFDNAAVPSILAYRNQGEMFGNLTGIIEMIPDDEAFGTETLRRLFEKHSIL